MKKMVPISELISLSRNIFTIICAFYSVDGKDNQIFLCNQGQIVIFCQECAFWIIFALFEQKIDRLLGVVCVFLGFEQVL